MRKRRSKFDLEGFAHCKIPKAQRAELKKFTDNTNIHWAEVVRMIVQKWINHDGRILELDKGVSEDFHPEPTRLTDVDQGVSE